MMLTFMILSWTLSMFFMTVNHPLSFGLILLLQTITISISSSIMSLDYWFSYVLFLIMIGGMLVLFIYMTSVASNEKFKFSNKLFMMSTILFMLFIPFMLFNDNFLFYIDMANTDLMNQSFMMPDTQMNLSISKFFNYPNMFIMIMIILYLLITLIAIVKITQSNMGPLRQMNQ